MCVTKSSIETDAPPASSIKFTVSVIMERREIARHGWSVPSWQLIGVVPSNHLASSTDQSGVQIRESDESRRYLWSGFELEFYRDSAEQYWHTLIGNCLLYTSPSPRDS